MDQSGETCITRTAQGTAIVAPVRPGSRAARPPAPPPVALADVRGRRRVALVCAEVAAVAVLVGITAGRWRTPGVRELAATLALAAAAAALTQATVPWAGAVPGVGDRGGEGTDSGLVVDLSGLALLVAALVLPVALVPVACLPSFAVDRVQGRRPLFAVVLNALVLTALTQVAALLRDVVAPGPAGQLRWAVAAWSAVALATLGGFGWALLGGWIVRGTVVDRSRVGEFLPVFQEVSVAATAVLAATLWRVDPWLVVYLAGPLAILLRLLTFREVQVAARTDDKTGLWNFRFFEESAQRELGRARRTGTPLSLLVVDMDRLRDVNNTYGHPVGDRALLHVARVLSTGARRYDLVCRFGGEEFLVLLPGTALEPATEVAERMRAAVRATPLRSGDRTVPVSVSIGVATLDPRTGDAGLEELLAAADARVYAAKGAGRDRVVAGPMPGVSAPDPA